MDPETLERFYRLVFEAFFVDSANVGKLELKFTDSTAAAVIGAEEGIVAELANFDPSGSLSDKAHARSAKGRATAQQKAGQLDEG